MSLRLIKPGLRSVGKLHPKTGKPIEPLYVREDGSVVWPVLGAASDDPDDPEFGEGGGDEDDEDEEDDEDDESTAKKPKKTAKPSKKDDEDEDDEDDEDAPEKLKAARQAKRYRLQLREEQRKNADMAARLKAIEDKDKKPDEVLSRDLDEANTKAAKLAEQNRDMTIRLAFFESNSVEWIDPADALRLVDLDEVEIDEDGNVDAKALRLALKDLAKRKPHLVKKARTASTADDDEEDDDESRSPRKRTAPTMNSSRKGKAKSPSRAELAKKFPVLGR